MYNFNIDQEAIDGAQKEQERISYPRMDTKTSYVFRVDDYKMDESQSGKLFVQLELSAEMGRDEDGETRWRKMPQSALRIYPEGAGQKYWLKILDAAMVLPYEKQVPGNVDIDLDAFVGAMFMARITYKGIGGKDSEYPSVVAPSIKKFEVAEGEDILA